MSNQEKKVTRKLDIAKSIIIVASPIVMILSLIGAIAFNYIQQEKAQDQFSQELYNHLLSKGYTEEDIIKTKTIKSKEYVAGITGKPNMTLALVIFEDDKNTTYFYHKEEDEETGEERFNQHDIILVHKSQEAKVLHSLREDQKVVKVDR